MDSPWITNSSQPPLERGEVHLWRLPWGDAEEATAEDSAVAPWLELLSAEERAGLARLPRLADRRRRGVGRGFTREILAHYGGVPARALPLTTAANGAVALGGAGAGAGDDGAEALRFNLTYATGWIVLAVTRGGRIGVDCERCWPEDVEPLVRQNFSAAEIAAWESFPAHQRGRAFYDGWTRKEAYLKALGVGLGRSPASFTVSLNPEPPVEWLIDPFAVEPTARWRLWTEQVDPGHSLAVVVEGAGAAGLRRWHFVAQAVTARS